MKRRGSIIAINKPIRLKEVSIRSLEAIHFRLFLLKLGFDCIDFISTKLIRREPTEDVEYYKDAAETDLNEYGHVFVHNDTDNFFGGALSKHTIKQIKELCRYKGNLYYLYTDPNLHLVNYARIIYDRQVRGTKTDYKTEDRITREEVDLFANLQWKVIWCGRNFEHFHKYEYGRVKKDHQCKVSRSENVDFFKFMFKNRQVEVPHLKLQERVFDLVYYGNWRPKRELKISAYLSVKLRKLVLGFNEKKLNLSNTEYLPYVPPEQLAHQVHQSVASVVIGDPAHNNNITTARFYENILFEVCSFIDLDYDPERRLYQSEFLKGFMYVRSGRELEEKIGMIKQDEDLFKKIITTQKQEII